MIFGKEIRNINQYYELSFKLKDLYNGNYSEDELADIKNFFSKLFGDKNSSDTINLNIKKLEYYYY